MVCISNNNDFIHENWAKPRQENKVENVRERHVTLDDLSYVCVLFG